MVGVLHVALAARRRVTSSIMVARAAIPSLPWLLKPVCLFLTQMIGFFWRVKKKHQLVR